MKELICVFVLSVVSFVTATPHGYGVKGGAAAKAESSAVAGAFGGLDEVPIAVPHGTSFSGSFSKSSASSFASSSATSSSSSYSFGGSGATGLAGSVAHGDGTGRVGCTTGSCQAGDTNTLPGAHKPSNIGNGLQPYNSAHADAAAGASAISGSTNFVKKENDTPCIGTNCPKHKLQCDSPNCDNETKDEKKCTSGKCESTTEKGVTSESDDIPINIPGSYGTKTSYDSDKESSGLTSNTFGNSASECTHRNCGSSSLNSRPYTHGTVNIYESNSNEPSTKCDSPPCYSSSLYSAGYGNADYNKEVPATHLTTPKECTDSNCKSSSDYSTNPGTGNLPLNYNVPSYPGLSPQGKIPTCTSGNCGETPANSHSLSTNYLNSASSNTKQTDAYGQKCESANCRPAPHNFESFKVPNNPTSSSLPTTSGSGGSINCATANCAGNPPAHISSADHTGSKPATYPYGTLPVHNPTAITGSAGCLTPNCAEFSSPQTNSGFSTSKNYPNYSSTKVPSYTLPSTISAFNCRTSNCASYPSVNAGNTAGNVHPGTVTDNASVSQKLPPYTGSFGGPAGILKPNDYSVPSQTGFINQQPLVKPYPSISPGTTTASHISAPINNENETKPKPIEISPTNQKFPSYTGSLGGPPGILKPNDYTLPSQTSFTHQQPIVKPIHPSISVGTAPASHINVPANIPTTNYFGQPTAPNVSYNPSTCVSGNCGSAKPETSVPNVSQVGSTHEVNADASAIASANAVAYSGGFGGPPGLLKPYDSNTPHNFGHGGHDNKNALVSQPNSQYSGTPGIERNPLHGALLNEAGTGYQASNAAKASAIAGTISNGFSKGYLQGNYNNQAGKDHQYSPTIGCTDNCDSVHSGQYGSGDLGLSGAQSLSKTASPDSFNGGFNAAGAVAKSTASATSGASSDSFGLGKSFASSSAAAHASSGVATKGGYGR